MRPSTSTTQPTLGASADGPAPAIPADLSLPTVEGGTLRFGDLRGKQVLLFCWASW